MTVEEYVEKTLCIPVTRVGFRYIAEAIELAIDTRDKNVYSRLSEIHNKSPRYLEKAVRDSKVLGLSYMNEGLKQDMFGDSCPTNIEYIVKAANAYRREYENKRS